MTIMALLIEGVLNPIFIDAGMRNADRALNIRRVRPHQTPKSMSLPDQLAKHSVKPEETGAAILSHLHCDSCGGCDQLPKARIGVQRRELAAAAAPIGPHTLDINSPWLFYDRRDLVTMVDTLWDRFKLIEGDSRLVRAIECICIRNPKYQAASVCTLSPWTVSSAARTIRCEKSI